MPADLALIVAGDYLMQVAGAVPPSTASPKLVHYRVRSAPRRVRESRRIAEVGFALVVGWTDPEVPMMKSKRRSTSSGIVG